MKTKGITTKRLEQIVEDFLEESEIPVCLFESIQPKTLTAIYYGFGLVAAVVRESDGFLVKLANTGLISHKTDMWAWDRETEPSDTEIDNAYDQFCKETLQEFCVSDFRALKITLANFGLERGIIFDPSLAEKNTVILSPLG